MNRRGFLFSLFAPLALGGGGAAQLPPLSFSCPMHPEVVDNAAGKCPICAMDLQPVRLALVWTCPVHNDIVTEPQAGRCRRCGRDLIRVTKAVSFGCPVHRTVESVDPGKCPRCRRTLVQKYTVRPHGDHNPKHGGSFFMVSNNWHLEATHPAPSVLRLYIYDNYSKPFSPPGLAARLVQVPDARGGRRDVDIPFARTGRGYYEARVPGLAAPATVAAKVRFEAGDKEYRFDFIFNEYSKAPAIRPRR